MRNRVNPEWIKTVKAELDELKRLDEIQNFNKVLSYNPSIQWLITYLTSINLSFKVINLGAGVKRITTDTSICPKCGGTGKC